MEMFENLLRSLQLTPLKLMPEGKAVVYQVAIQEYEFIAKISYDSITKEANEEEEKILDKLRNVSRTPKLINLLDTANLEQKIAEYSTNNNITNPLVSFTQSKGTSIEYPTILLKSYFEGHTYHEQTNALTEHQRILLLDEINLYVTNGFSNLDIKPANILITPNGNIKLFDLDTVFDKKEDGKKLFDIGVNRDYDCFEGLEFKRFKAQGSKRPDF